MIDHTRSTCFMISCVPNCEAEELNLSGMIISSTWETWDVAMSSAVRKGFRFNSSCDYSHAYTAGHYGDDDYLWEFENYVVYEPIKGDDTIMVMLRYKPVGCKTSHVQRMIANQLNQKES
jgi:hypothetical protein